MTTEIPAENLPKEIQKDKPFIEDGLLSEIDALEEKADRDEAKDSKAPCPGGDTSPKAG